MRKRFTLLMVVAFTLAMFLGAAVSTVHAWKPFTSKCVEGIIWECFIWQWEPVMLECCLPTKALCFDTQYWFYRDGKVITYICTQPDGQGDCHLMVCPEQ